MEEQLTIFDFLTEAAQETEHQTQGHSAGNDFSLQPFINPTSEPVIDKEFSFSERLAFFNSTHDRDAPRPEVEGEQYYLSSPRVLMAAKFLYGDYLKGRYHKFLTAFSLFNGEEAAALESLGVVLPRADRYKPIIQIESIASFPIVGFFNVDYAIQEGMVRVLNALFEDYPKKQEGNKLMVRLPIEVEQVFDGFLSFVDGRPANAVLKELTPDGKLLYLALSPYVDYLTDCCHTPSSTEPLTLGSLLSKHFSYEDNVLTIDISKYELVVNTEYGPTDMGYVDRANRMFTDDYLYRLKELYYLILHMELIGSLAPYIHLSIMKKKETDKEMVNELIASAKDQFMTHLNTRLVPVESLDHKGAQADAKKLGLTHLFIPVSNNHRLSQSNDPVLLVDSEGDAVLLPPHLLSTTIGSSVSLSTYAGFFEDYPDIVTRKTPHLVGDELKVARIDEGLFMQTLVDHYTEWEHYETLVHTLTVLAKHKLAKGRLLKLLPEENPEENKKTTLMTNFVSVPSPIDSLFTFKSSLGTDGTALKKGMLVSDNDGEVYEIVNTTLSFVEQRIESVINLKHTDTEEVKRVPAGTPLTIEYELMEEQLKTSQLTDFITTFYSETEGVSETIIAYNEELDYLIYKDINGVTWHRSVKDEVAQVEIYKHSYQHIVSELMKASVASGYEVYSDLFAANLKVYTQRGADFTHIIIIDTKEKEGDVL